MAALAECIDREAHTFAGLPMPLTVRLPVPMTNEELLAYSAQHRPYRIERNVAGELEIMSPVKTQGGEWEAYVILELGLWARSHGGRVYSSNAGFTLPDSSMRSPDASWISEAKWQSLEPERRRGFAAVCPEFLIEIVSESDQRSAVESKMELWLANGAGLAWMIDPYLREVLVFAPASESVRLAGPKWVEADRVVPGFRLALEQLWDESPQG